MKRHTPRILNSMVLVTGGVSSPILRLIVVSNEGTRFLRV
jgi:hypothetical protein